MRILVRQGSGIAPFIDDLARLRIAVFRAFPYLYEGTLDYEKTYVATYARSQDSVFVLALDGDRVVGASTGIPMRDETDAFKAPFLKAGWNPERIFYFGESVLMPDYRGQGLGVRFFEEREAHARRLGGFDICCFCAVERPADHPLRPADHQPLDTFWTRRGYTHHPDLRTEYVWRDVGETHETAKPMSFWMKEIR
ncbi:GNAT family N-acetyltransferase [Rhizobiaceae bacterium BDR2-2]|uniref:GNAT family N-acetyltransferase n=1 Tax=Ectorhizobium quercum TaxID=2965071 RepID=A0AAE3N0W0_9HYPH|nr:GNAT family N-acetyltransferase [Ectorhizobium quercum]MCX8998091.1 GNAT family N-acetyltransferase [Ectorhizobium quercum]